MLKILIADDEPIHLKSLAKLIQGIYPGCEILTADNGVEALEIAKMHNLDIVISDIRMPGMDGLQFIEGMGDRVKRTRVIILSAYGYFEYAQKALKLGAFDYILKPVDEDIIREVMDKAIASLPAKEQEEKGDDKSDDEDASIIELCKKYIAEHYMERLTLESVSEKFYFNRTYFCKYFKKYTGKNFSEYLTEVRLNKSKELLESTNMKIYSISSMIGYDDPKYFHRQFKKAFGITPDEYRINICRNRGSNL